MLNDNPDIFREVLESLQSGILLVDHTGKIAFWNEGAERISGYRRHEVVGRLLQHNILTHCDEHNCDGCGAMCPFANVLHEGKARSGSMHIQHKDGHRVAVQAWTAPIRNPHGSVVGVVQNFSEIHAAAREEPLRTSHAWLGADSRLPDQEYCRLYLHEQLAGFTHYRSPFGILRIHVPRLERVAAQRGREAEEALVRRMALAAHETVYGDDFFGRWTSDEFLMLVANCSATELAQIAQHLQESLSHVSLHWWGDEVSLEAFVTHSVVQPGDTIELLFQRAGFAHSSPSSKSASAG